MSSDQGKRNEQIRANRLYKEIKDDAVNDDSNVHKDGREDRELDERDDFNKIPRVEMNVVSMGMGTDDGMRKV